MLNWSLFYQSDKKQPIETTVVIDKTGDQLIVKY